MEEKKRDLPQPTQQQQIYQTLDLLMAQAQQENNQDLVRALQQMRNDPTALAIALGAQQHPINHANQSSITPQQQPQQQQDQWNHGVVLQSLITPQQQQAPKMDYDYYTNQTWNKIKNEGMNVGDINFKNQKVARLYPSCVGRYFELVDPIQLSELHPFVEHVKEVIRIEILTSTNRITLTDAMQASINQITVENIAGFLLQDSMDVFGTLVPESQQWLHLKTTVSYKCYTNYALFYDLSFDHFVTNAWCSSPAKFPPIKPDSPLIRKMIKKFTNVKVAGWILFDKNTNKKHFIKEDFYRRCFTNEEWNLKNANQCFYHWNNKKASLIKVKQGQKPKYLFFSLRSVTCFL